MGSFARYPAIIAPDALDLSPAPAEFQQSFADIVGNAATDTDGFETLFSLLASHVGDTAGFLAGFDSDLFEIGTAASNFDIPIEQDALDAHAAALASGQPAIDGFNSSKDPSQRRIWPGSVMTALSLRHTIGTDTGLGGGTVVINHRPWPLENLLPLPITVGIAPFPVKVGIAFGGNLTPEQVKLFYLEGIDLDADVPVIEQVWSDAFTSMYAGEVWNFYLDINPCMAGDWKFNVRLHLLSGGISFIACRVIVLANPAFPETCAPPAPTPPAPTPPAPTPPAPTAPPQPPFPPPPPGSPVTEL